MSDNEKEININNDYYYDKDDSIDCNILRFGLLNTTSNKPGPAKAIDVDLNLINLNKTISSIKSFKDISLMGKKRKKNKTININKSVKDNNIIIDDIKNRFQKFFQVEDK
jgi:hypothetical protein